MKKLNYIAVGGISAAAAFLLVFAASLVPAPKLALMFCAGLCPLVLLSKHKVLYAAACHIASVLLMLLFIPNVFYAIGYGALFGLYPFLRYFARKTAKKRTEMLILWASAFVLMAAVGAVFLIVAGTGAVKLPLWAAGLLLLPVSAAAVWLEDVICAVFTRFLGRLKI